jgi:diguanylate cyclase (GGDEF)-like protein
MIYERVKLTQAYWTVFVSMLVMLTLLTIGMTAYQWNMLIVRETESLEYDLSLAAEFIKEDLAKKDVAHIELFFQQWAENNPTVISIETETLNGMAIAPYRTEKHSTNVIELQQTIDAPTPLILKVTFDVSPIHMAVKRLLLIIVGANIFFLALLMLVMWVVTRRYLIKPLIESEDKLLDLATLDSLTQVYNRGSFFATTRDEIQRCKRTNHPVCLVMLDLDHFKRINDHFGHATGDLVLILFSTELKMHIRGYDIVGRVGGEEFAVCMPELGINDGLEAARRICKRINQLPRLEGSIEQAISVSIGVTEMKADDSLESMLSRCDEALYQAKQGGRNCVRQA